MRFGITSGFLWGLDTVILGIALTMGAFIGTPEAIAFAAIASAFMHDVACAIWLFLYMGVRRRLGDTLRALKTRSGKVVMLGALLGGPLGMTGYLVAINNIGAGYTAIISAFYPAFGTFMAFVLLKERMRPRQLVALACALAGHDVVIASVTPVFDAAFFEAADGLRLLVRHGIGYDNVDVAACDAAGCVLTTVPPLVERDAVAEAAVALLLDLMRQVSDSHVSAVDGRWSERARFVGAGLTGKTLGVIGCGNIGSRVAEILSRGFDMRLLACDPVERSEWVAGMAARGVDVSYVGLDELLANADVVSLNADLNPTSFHILDEAAIAKLKRGAYVVNNARAGLIDRQAMLDALASGTVRGLALDVMEEEPPAADDPYLAHPRVLVCPHISAYTEECLRGMGEKCVADVERYAAGEPPQHRIRA